MDQALFHLINEQWTSPALDLFMGALSDMKIWQPLLVLLGLSMLVFRGFKGRAFVFCLVFTIGLSEALVVRSLKAAVGRPRPKQSQTVRLVQLQRATPKILTLLQQPRVHYSTTKDLREPGAGSSFPSGHVTNNVVVAVFCTLFFGRWGALYFVVAALIGYSRIYLGAHWPSDVVATAFMAAGLALLAAALLEWFWRRTAPRVAPELFARHPRLIGATAP
ncbi:MAG: phosphatase PAP2 family protein [Chthoniobacterales bacterium]|nr:phosphatase PAP2 family protein [Chthoniobacterales bacterium]